MRNGFYLGYQIGTGERLSDENWLPYVNWVDFQARTSFENLTTKRELVTRRELDFNVNFQTRTGVEK